MPPPGPGASARHFLNYLERDFPWTLGEIREAHERDGVRVVSAGPNAFVYFVDSPTPLSLGQIDDRCPGLVDEMSCHRGIGFALLVIYGHGSPDGNVSFIPEQGAHAGPSREELHTFVIHPARVPLPDPIVHPVQLHPVFAAYLEPSTARAAVAIAGGHGNP